MEHFLSHLVMDAERNVSQRKTMKEMSVTRDNIASDDEGRQITGLLELCNLLNMSTSLTIASIQPNVFVPLLLKCLGKEHNADLMLFSARALTYMVDAINSTVYVLGSEGGVEAVLKHLLEVKDIEVSEQCLTCIEKITQNPNGAVMGLQNGGVKALLVHIDFFSSSSQRKAWASVASMCRRVDISTFNRLEDSLDEIHARIDHDDSKISEKAITCIYRIILGVRSKSELVAKAFGNISFSLLTTLNKNDVSENTFNVTLALIGAAVAYSTEVTKRVIETGLAEFLLTLTARSTEQLQLLQSPDSSPMLQGQTSSSPPPLLVGSFQVDPNLRSASREKRLTVEQTKSVCVALSSLLPKIIEGYLAKGEILTELLTERPRGLWQSKGFMFSSSRNNNNNNNNNNNYGDEDEDEEDDEIDEAYTHEEIMARILEEGIPIEKNINFTKFGSPHICDSCDKSLKPGDWFHCNKCSNIDFCGQCLLVNWEEHTGGSPQHTFCDVMDVIPEVKKSTPPTKTKETTEDTLNTEREMMYKQNPHLLDVILTGLPRMVAFCNESETHLVRNHCLAFIYRAICLATPEQLINCGLSEAAVCEMIVAAMTDTSLTLNVQVMPLCRKLLEKLNNNYMSAFVREGVTNALSKVQHHQMSQMNTRRNSSSNNNNNERGADKKPLIERLNTISDWRELVISEAKSILSMFPTINEETRNLRLLEVVSLMQDGQLQEAFNKLRLSILEETTSFELSSSNLLHELRETLTRVNDINVIISFIKTLAIEVPNAPCALTRFIRHLQTVLSHLDQFRAPSFGEVKSIHVQIPLRLVPHSSDNSTSTKSVTLKRTSTGNNTNNNNSSSTFTSKETSSKRPTRVTTIPSTATTTTTTNTNNNSTNITGATTNTSITSSRSTLTVSNTHTSHNTTTTTNNNINNTSNSNTKGSSTSERREVAVSVEPLTNMEALMSFVSVNLLSGGIESAMSRRRVESEDQVEEIFPELGKEDNTTEVLSKSKKSSRAKTPPRVYLRYENHVLPPSMTILQVLQQFRNSSQTSSSLSSKSTTSTKKKGNNTENKTTQQLLAIFEESKLGSGEYITLHYSTVPYGPEYKMESTLLNFSVGSPSDPIIIKKPSEDIRPPAVIDVMRALHHEFPASNKFLTVAQKDVLILLGTIYEALRNWSELLKYIGTSGENFIGTDIWSPSTSLSEFIHHKLNNKAMRHCSNLLLAGQHLTTWAVNLAHDCNFLFTTATRKFLFEVSFCGTVRSLVQMQENMEKYGIRDSLNSDHQFTRSYRLHREKKRVWRDKALKCALKILGKERISGSVVLEFEYYNENGSGTGPTNEFYTLVSDELRETNLRLWRRTDEIPDEKYYRPQKGVYPIPLNPNSSELDRIEPFFLFLGRFLARALLDKRILSISLSPVLLKMLRGDECSIYDLTDISESLGTFMLSLSHAARNNSKTIILPGTNKSCTIEELGLDFTVPGDEVIELKPGGNNIPVTSNNILEYCDLVTTFILRTGVERAVKALRVGFHDYIPLFALRMLTISELHETIHGRSTLITMEELDTHCQADHGYTMGSKHVRQLFEIITSFNAEEQHRFFLFLTGSAYLPVGGLASLRPKFTIVRKTSSDSKVREQDQLPSAMTCQNYLKLPAYESKEQMEQKLRQAIDEGCGAFLLT